VGGADGEDIPEVDGDDVGGEEIELVGGIDDVARADGADIRVVAFVDGALDLNAAKEAVMVCRDSSTRACARARSRFGRGEKQIPRAFSPLRGCERLGMTNCVVAERGATPPLFHYTAALPLRRRSSTTPPLFHYTAALPLRRSVGSAQFAALKRRPT
jgi:hypothetical protein